MLVDMGFPKDRAELALKKGPGCRSFRICEEDAMFLCFPAVLGAIDWLDKRSATSTEDLLADEAEVVGGQATISLNSGSEAKSLLCKDCGKRFASTEQAEFHASKTEHTNFEESSQEVVPLTEEEKQAKLEESVPPGGKQCFLELTAQTARQTCLEACWPIRPGQSRQETERRNPA